MQKNSPPVQCIKEVSFGEEASHDATTHPACQLLIALTASMATVCVQTTNEGYKPELNKRQNNAIASSIFMNACENGMECIWNNANGKQE